ncbi:MAG: hypothetical protein ABSG91_11050, partial [Syntrophobacteraceae bacterium]
MRETLLEGFPVIVECQVAWGGMDALRHVNNVAYFRYFENVRIACFDVTYRIDLPNRGIAIAFGPVADPNGALTLQRYLCPEQQSLLRMRKVCTVISNLNPFNHNKEFFDTQ